MEDTSKNSVGLWQGRSWQDCANVCFGPPCGKVALANNHSRRSKLRKLRQDKAPHAAFFMGHGRLRSVLEVAEGILKQLPKAQKDSRLPLPESPQIQNKSLRQPEGRNESLSVVPCQGASSELQKYSQSEVSVALEQLGVFAETKRNESITILLDAWEASSMTDVDDFSHLLMVLINAKYSVVLTSRSYDERLVPSNLRDKVSRFDYGPEHSTKRIRSYAEFEMFSRPTTKRLFSRNQNLENEFLQQVLKKSAGS